MIAHSSGVGRVRSRSELIEEEWQKYLAHEKRLQEATRQKELSKYASFPIRSHTDPAPIKLRSYQTIAKELLKEQDFERANDLIDELGAL